MSFLEVPELGGYFNNFLHPADESTYSNVASFTRANLKTPGLQKLADKSGNQLITQLAYIGRSLRSLNVQSDSDMNLFNQIIFDAVPNLKDLSIPTFHHLWELPRDLESLEIDRLFCTSTNPEQVFDFRKYTKLKKIIIRDSSERKPIPFIVRLPKTVEVIRVGPNVSLDYSILFHPRLTILSGVTHLRNITKSPELRIPSRCLQVIDLDVGLLKRVSFSGSELEHVHLYCLNKTEVEKYLMSLTTLQCANVYQMWCDVPEDPPLGISDNSVVLFNRMNAEALNIWRRIHINESTPRFLSDPTTA